MSYDIEKFNKMSVRDIHNKFSKWYKLSTSGASISELYKEIQFLCTQLPFHTIEVSKQNLYRCRPAKNEIFLRKPKIYGTQNQT